MTAAPGSQERVETVQRPDVDAIEVWMKRRYTGTFMDPVEVHVEKLIAYIRYLEAQK